MKQKKQHIFRYDGAYGFIGTLCGIKNRDGIIYNTGKKMNCKRCLKNRKGEMKQRWSKVLRNGR